MIRFAEMQKKTPAPKVKELSEVELSKLSDGSKEAAQAAKQALSDIIKCIADMKAADAAFVDSAFKEVLKRGNTIDLQLGVQWVGKSSDTA